MMSKILIYVDDLNHLDDYRKVGISAFLFGLDEYCVGYNTYSLNEINKVQVSNKYLLINRVLDCQDIDKLKKILPELDSSITGLVFEDISLFNMIKKLNPQISLILFQNHFATNVLSVNFWLERVKSIVLSNELTSLEIDNILKQCQGQVCLHLYGYNQVMYSRRLLLRNWSEEFNIPYKNMNVLEDKATHVKFRAVENSYGTVMYSENIYNGQELLNLDNQDKVLFYYVNPMLINHDQVMSFLNTLSIDRNTDIKQEDNSIKQQEDDGFLHKETIYKLKERAK